MKAIRLTYSALPQAESEVAAYNVGNVDGHNGSEPDRFSLSLYSFDRQVALQLPHAWKNAVEIVPKDTPVLLAHKVCEDDAVCLRVGQEDIAKLLAQFVAAKLMTAEVRSQGEPEFRVGAESLSVTRLKVSRHWLPPFEGRASIATCG